MKKIITISILLITAQFASAQLIKVGIVGGLGSANYTFDKIEYINEEDRIAVNMYHEGNVLAYNIGAMARVNIPLLPMSARISALYSGTGGKVGVYDIGANSVRVTTENNGRVEIPLQLSINLTKVRIIGGVGYAFDVNRGTNTVDYLNAEFVNTGKFDFDVVSKKLNYWTYSFGLGLELDKIELDLIFNGAMSEDISADAANNAFVFAPNSGVFTVNLTYFLFQ